MEKTSVQTSFNIFLTTNFESKYRKLKSMYPGIILPLPESKIVTEEKKNMSLNYYSEIYLGSKKGLYFPVNGLDRPDVPLRFTDKEERALEHIVYHTMPKELLKALGLNEFSDYQPDGIFFSLLLINFSKDVGFYERYYKFKYKQQLSAPSPDVSMNDSAEKDKTFDINYHREKLKNKAKLLLENSCMFSKIEEIIRSYYTKMRIGVNRDAKSSIESVEIDDQKLHTLYVPLPADIKEVLHDVARIYMDIRETERAYKNTKTYYSSLKENIGKSKCFEDLIELLPRVKNMVDLMAVIDKMDKEMKYK